MLDGACLPLYGKVVLVVVCSIFSTSLARPVPRVGDLSGLRPLDGKYTKLNSPVVKMWVWGVAQATHHKHTYV